MLKMRNTNECIAQAIATAVRFVDHVAADNDNARAVKQSVEVSLPAAIARVGLHQLSVDDASWLLSGGYDIAARVTQLHTGLSLFELPNDEMVLRLACRSTSRLVGSVRIVALSHATLFVCIENGVGALWRTALLPRQHEHGPFRSAAVQQFLAASVVTRKNSVSGDEFASLLSASSAALLTAMCTLTKHQFAPSTRSTTGAPPICWHSFSSDRVHLLPWCMRKFVSEFEVGQATAAGNCLFSSIALLLYDRNDDMVAMWLRAQCVVELIENFDC